jgi:hypothetical protein
VPNPSQGILNSAQELAVCLVQPDLRAGIGFTIGYVDPVPGRLACGGNQTDQALAVGEFLPLRKEEILVAKHVALVHGNLFWKSLCDASVAMEKPVQDHHEFI